MDQSQQPGLRRVVRRGEFWVLAVFLVGGLRVDSRRWVLDHRHLQAGWKTGDLYSWESTTSLASSDEYFVSPTGSPNGDGSRARPWDLATALAQPRGVQPGDTLSLLGGTYSGTFTSSLTGTAAAPITVRSVPGQWAVIDGETAFASTLTVNGAWTTYRDFEVMKSDPNRVSQYSGSDPPDISRGSSDGISVFGAHTRFIDLVVHDDGEGFGFWTPAEDALIYGTLIYNNGWLGTDRGHGHGIYTQNQDGTKWIVDSIILNQYGYGIHAYTEGGAIQGFSVIGNAFFHNGSAAGGDAELQDNCLIGGLQPASRVLLQDNYAWSPTPTTLNVQLGYSSPDNQDVTLLGNYIAGRTLFAQPWQSIAMHGNTFYSEVDGIDTSQYPDNTYLNTRPTRNKVIIRPNRFQPERANIIVYNWTLADTLDIDVSDVLQVGSRYVLHNAQDYFGPPVLSGMYDGHPLRVPMTGLSVARPIGSNYTPMPTGPEFNVFVLVGS